MVATRERTFDWDSYGQQVLAGEIPVCKWTRLAVERHYRDLKEGPARGLWFSEDHAQHALEFFLFLRHSKGEWAGEQFVPSPWQQFWVALAFGWMRADGTRRFRRVWEEVPRKNGKSTKLSGIGLYLFSADGEGGPEVYTAATKMDQAKITHDEAVRMVHSSPQLRRHISDRRGELFIRGKADTFRPLGRDSKSLDGLNPHGAIMDEVHAHPDSGMLDVIRSGTGARKQWLIWMITTAGTNLRGPGFDLHGYAEKVLEGVFDDDEFLAVIYTVDDPDKWQDPLEWQKANPNLGVSVYLQGLKDACDSAIRLPSEQSEFKTKRLNIWLSGGAKWIALADWRACEDKSLKLEDFAGKRCWIGLDLAERRDIAAVCYVFRENGKYYVFWRFYQNEYQASLLENQHYRKWSEAGFLHITPGNATDFDVIGDQISGRRAAHSIEVVEQPGDLQMFAVEELDYDPKFAPYFVKKLMEKGVPAVEIGQNPTTFTAPIIEVENLVLTGQLVHEENPVMDWMISNAKKLTSKYNGLSQIGKDRESEKIDGVLAMLMAIARATAAEFEEPPVEAGIILL
ncbi:terminase large subunit [Pseudomonas sp. 32.2.56]|uniref:terminase large subunit n=1 Tax=Pseudomonas sp. 32.2.56 TaxID=2969303 RepID=UPI0021501A04|nr:terminase TerL endonuclease subunit [Pseudomonas sp. 32.2.56]MCR4508920.1 terminase large subunit [Pseudomonas sp. 32.2.56]